MKLELRKMTKYKPGKHLVKVKFVLLFHKDVING